MNKTILGSILCVVVLAGCGERAVVGETAEGVIRGGDTLKVSGDAPPRAAASALKNAQEAAVVRRGSLLPSDPWLRAQLAQSGSVIPGPMAPDVFLRPASAPPAAIAPDSVPAPLAPDAVPASPVAPAAVAPPATP